MNAQSVEHKGNGRGAKLPLPAAWLCAIAAVALGACTAILGIEEATLDTSAAAGHGGAGGAECQGPDDCPDDANPCTENQCNAGTCSYPAVENGPAPDNLQTPGDCKRYVCTNGSVLTQADDADLPVDDNDCTEDLCTNGTASNPAVANGDNCAQNGGTVCYLGNCVECYDNTQCQAPETCSGGPLPYVCGCTPNACDDLSCGFATDTKCGGGTLNCNNNIQDGAETDVDCGGLVHTQGGTCNLRCNDGKHCVNPSDCATTLCNCGHCGADGCSMADAG